MQRFNISTDSIILRKLELSDRDEIFDLLTDSDVMEFIGPKRPMTSDEIDFWIYDNLDKYNNGWNRWAAAIKESNEFIGMVGIFEYFNRRDFGFYFRKKFWGTGVPKECVNFSLLEINSQGIDYEIFVDSENIRCVKLIDKLGFIKGKELARDGSCGNIYTKT